MLGGSELIVRRLAISESMNAILMLLVLFSRYLAFSRRSNEEHPHMSVRIDLLVSMTDKPIRNGV